MNIFTKVKVIFTLICFIGSGHPIHAQEFEWVKSIGGPGASVVGSTASKIDGVAVDAGGNVYVTGTFNGTADFDPGPDSAKLVSMGGNDIFIAKYDTGGNYIWAKNIGGTNTDNGSDLAVDTAGNIYVTGSFGGSIFGGVAVDFDPGPDSAKLVPLGISDAFVAKYDTGGNYVWAIRMGGSSSDNGYGVAVDAAGNVLVTGSFQSPGQPADFDPGPDTAEVVSAGSIDAFIAKYDAGGHYVWARNMGGTGADYGNKVAVDAGGNVYVVGNFSGTAYFNGPAQGSLVSGGGDDIFVAKYDAGGNYLWAKGMGGSAADQGLNLAVDAGGNVHITGVFRGTVDFDPGPDSTKLVSSGNADFFVAKYNTGGDYAWAKGIGGSGADNGYGLAVDPGGNVYVSGTFAGPADFDPGPDSAKLVSAGGANVFVAKYDIGGNYVWAKSIAASLNYGVAVERGNVHVTGSFAGTVDFDPGPDSVKLTVAGNSDFFILKMSQPSCNTSSTLTISACNSYTLNGHTYTSSGSYAQTFTNAAGCDSVVTLFLTIKNNSSTLTQAACDSFVFNGITCKTSGVYTDTLTNAGGCDSVVTLNLTIKHSSPVTHYTDTACNSFVFLGHTYTQSGSYADTFTNTAGCDSIITLDLTVHYASDTVLTIHACDSLVLNDSVYTISGAYVQVLPNAAGCDSTITLQLTVNSSPEAAVVRTGNTLAAGNAPAYQWVDCNNGFAAIPGATAQIYTPAASGDYAVVVTSGNGCSDTSDCFTVEIPDNNINTLGAGNPVQLYPNPAKDQVTIQTGKALQNATIRLLSLLGQPLAEQTGQKGTLFMLDMSGYATGIYFAEISEGGRSVRLKVVKE